MAGTLARVVAPFVVSFALVASATTHAAAAGGTQRLHKAAGYLASVQNPDGSFTAFSLVGSTADAVSAFVASGVGAPNMKKAIGYLSSQVTAGEVNTIGLQAKVVLAVVAAGRNPRSFAGQDLVGEIEGTLQPSGQFGDAVVLDDALAALALRAARVTPDASVAGWLIAAQCPDGGWAYDKPYDPGTDDADCFDGSQNDFFTADSNTTSYVVQALEALGDDAWTDDPFAYFDTVRDPAHGGWSYSGDFVATDANSTALVLQAYDAAGRTIPSGGMDALRALQYSTCGAFAYNWNGSDLGPPDIGATIGAVPALAHQAFPVRGTAHGPAPSVPAC
jgi:hypothetical protein